MSHETDLSNLQASQKGPTAIRTRVIRIKTEGDNHYTIEPILKNYLSKIIFAPRRDRTTDLRITSATHYHCAIGALKTVNNPAPTGNRTRD